MNELEPVRPEILEGRPSGLATAADRRLAKRTDRALANLEQRTLLRMARTQSEGFTAAEKLREVDRMTRVAVDGHAFLSNYVTHLAGDDVILADDLRFFVAASKLAKGEIVANTVNRFRCI